MNWTYYSLTGFPYRIDMYHGEESGHLIIFVNSSIIMVEFNQKKSKSFSFLIENQLIELAIKQDSNGYEYVVTPQIIKKFIEKPEKIFDESFWIPLIIIIIAVNLIALFIINKF